MKPKNYIFLFSFVLLSSFSAIAQPYQSIFGEHSTGWVFAWYNLPGTVRDSIFVDGEVIMNGYTYKKIVTLQSSVYPGGLLREDTVSGKVWYKGSYASHPADTVEHLIFDYSLQVGDSLDVSDIYSSDASGQKSRVDSVTVINDRKYLYFSATGNIEPISFIEGIGSNCGVIKLRSSPMLARYLLCSYKDGIKTDYMNKQYNGSCDIATAVPETQILPGDITIYPVPARDILHIKNNSGTRILQVILYTVDGRVIRNINASDIQDLSLNGIPDGYYFLRLSTQNASVLNYKVTVRGN